MLVGNNWPVELDGTEKTYEDVTLCIGNPSFSILQAPQERNRERGNNLDDHDSNEARCFLASSVERMTVGST